MTELIDVAAGKEDDMTYERILDQCFVDKLIAGTSRAALAEYDRTHPLKKSEQGDKDE